MGRPVAAASLGLLQMFGLMVPLGLLGSHFFGLVGLFVAIGIAYFLTGLAGRWMMTRVIRGGF
jgi:Na+-driven multidrug efflux pump